MIKQKNSKLQKPYYSGLFLIWALILSQGLSAQIAKIPINQEIKISVDQDYIDYKVPEVKASSFLYIEAKGADGGKYTCWAKIDRGGGKGAVAKGVFKIGTGDNEIAPGTTIRLIVGKKGSNNDSCDDGGAGGGGGTGVLILPVGGTSWSNESSPLIAAGGGGGAAKFGDGRAANTESMGRAGMKSGGEASNGGINKEPGGCSLEAEGGASFRKNVSSNLYSNTAKAGKPEGGQGGDNKANGGFGFGGGGGSAGSGGGGGGGYSGGGAGYDQDKAGGGGGSFVNPTFGLVYDTITADGATKSPGHGYIKMMLMESVKTLQLASATEKCVTNAGGKSDNDNNIQLFDCKTNLAAQQWFFDDFKLHTLSYPNKCMDVANHGTSNGTNVRLWDCMEHNEQRWIYDGLTKQLRSFLNLDKCLNDAYGGRTTNGTNIQLWNCSDGGENSDQWIVTNAVTISAPSAVQYIVPVKYSNRALQSINGAKSGSNIQMGTKSSTDNSIRFVFKDMQVQYGPSKDLCLGLANKSTTNGTNIQLMASASDEDTRKWIYDGQTKQIRSLANPNKCIEVETTGLYAVGSNLKLMDCSDHLRQQFDVVER